MKAKILRKSEYIDRTFDAGTLVTIVSNDASSLYAKYVQRNQPYLKEQFDCGDSVVVKFEGEDRERIELADNLQFMALGDEALK